MNPAPNIESSTNAVSSPVLTDGPREAIPAQDRIKETVKSLRAHLAKKKMPMNEIIAIKEMMKWMYSAILKSASE